MSTTPPEPTSSGPVARQAEPVPADLPLRSYSRAHLIALDSAALIEHLVRLHRISAELEAPGDPPLAAEQARKLERLCLEILQERELWFTWGHVLAVVPRPGKRR